MRTLLICASAFCLSLFVRPTHACGGGFGQDVTIHPEQTIVIAHRAGQESYVFQPRFCGAASEFGLLLPVPATLTQNPTLVESALYAELADLTAPRVETVDVCKQGGFGFGSMDKSAGDVPESSNTSDGIDVVNQGTVGLFSWSLLKADSARTFADWLDANHFPYPTTAVAAFEYYVKAGYYFVAFQVTASPKAPPSGYRICGAFGPIRLAFLAAQAVIPARMATSTDRSSTFNWRVITVANHQYATQEASQVQPTLRFAAQLTDGDLTAHPAVASVATAGEWLTELDLSFYAASQADDITLAAASEDKSYRRVVFVENEVSCGVFGCNVTAVPKGASWVGALLAIMGSLLVWTGTKRQPRKPD